MNPESLSPGKTVDEVVRELTLVELPSSLNPTDAPRVLDQLNTVRRVLELSQQVWFKCLALVQPKLMKDLWFACAEGPTPLKLFWVRGGRYYARQLNWQETWALCDASGLPKNYK